ncbi:MAG: gamma-glutamyltransferase [Hyphomicrobiaceae bacterium]|nr:gamma-glutamyltransferase [Hyphomicrobiaceae bacterium]
MHKGIVAAGHRATAAAATEILRAGGNAFDATIAGLYAACVAEPVLASPGGGGFLMAHDPDTGTNALYDFFVDTPRHKRSADEQQFFAVEVDFGPATQEFHIGLGSSATPGFIPGLFAVHEAHGRLPMADLIAPAIAAARDGVTVNAFQAYLFKIAAPIYMHERQSAAIFAPGGEPLREGDRLLNPALAEAYALLAREGKGLFCDGEVGREMVRQSRQLGGHLDARDLHDYEVVRRAPLLARHKGADLYLNPAPAASGPLIAFSLRLIESLTGDRAPDIVEIAEAMAATNAARRTYGLTPERLLDGDVIAEHLAVLMHHAEAYRGTTHISVVDAEGRAASATVSNGEGNGFLVGPFGFMLNNMLGEEDVNPHGAEGWPAGVRLASMMAPTIAMRDDGELLVLGSGGSNRIRSAIAQVLAHAVLNNKPIDQSVLAPRLHVEENHLEIEAGFSTEEEELLQERFPSNRVWPDRSMFFGGCHAVSRAANGKLAAAGDPRRAGAGLVL